jgi:AcrR family transcriptional regulator
MSKETASRIQKKAVELFKESGYPAVTIENICKAGGITKSTFYYHFNSKAELLGNFYENSYELTPEITRILATSDNNWEKLWACLEPSIDWSVEAGVSILSQFIITNIENGTDIFSLPNAREQKDIYIGIIQKGQQSGHFQNQSDAVALYNNIFHILKGITVQWCLAGGAFDKKAAIKTSLVTLLEVRDDLRKH